MVMAKKPSEYTSIAEIRASFYPGSAGMLDLDRGEILDFPSTLAGKTRQIMESIAKQAAEATDEKIEVEESQADESLDYEDDIGGLSLPALCPSRAPGPGMAR